MADSKFVPPRIPREETGITKRLVPAFQVGAVCKPGEDKWKAAGVDFGVLLGWQDGVSLFKDLLETLNTVSELLSAILKLSEVFVNDFRSLTNLLKVSVGKILAEIQAFLRDIENTGLYSLVVLPELNEQNAAYFPVGGGFNGFKQKVTQALFNTKDPNRPNFSDSAHVGGIVLLLTADASDPKAISDLIDNLRTLSNFFPGFAGSAQPASPVNVRAIPGFYPEPVVELTGGIAEVGAAVPSALNISRKLGIKVVWEDNPNLSIFNIKQRTTKYYVFRSTKKEGTPLGKDDRPIKGDVNRDDLKLFNGKVVFVYGNEGYTDKDLFNGGRAKLIYNEPFNKLNEIVDFDILEGQEYFYIIVPAFGDINDTFFDKTGFFAGKFGLPSPVVSAKAIACIPDRLLNWVEYPGGRFIQAREGDGPFWNSITIRSLLGPQADKVIKALTDIVNILGASIENSNASLQDFQRSFARRIRNYLKIIEKLERLADVIGGITITGGEAALILNLEFAEGGIKCFSNRFNAAKIPEKLSRLNNVSGITAGAVILFGRPGSTSDAIRNFSNKSEYQFLPDPFSNTKSQAKTDAISEPSSSAINFIKNLFRATSG